MVYMGIDYGIKRVGVALSDEGGRLAFPHAVVPNTPELVSTLVSLCRKKNVSLVVVGESTDFAGKDNPLMEHITPFVTELQRETGLSVVLHPEFLTSHQAVQIQGKNDMLDASAASIVLQSYIDTHL